MPKIVTISAKVESGPTKKTVLLTSDQMGLAKGDTFNVVHGDTVKWMVSGAPAGLKVQVKIVQFADSTDARRLFGEETAQHALPPSDREIAATIHAGAHKGHYRYEVALVGGPQPIPLICLWSSGPGQPTEELTPPMGGGVQTDPPPGG